MTTNDEKTGLVKWFKVRADPTLASIGYGFLAPDQGGPDVFFNVEPDENSQALDGGVQVAYREVPNERTKTGVMAVALRPL